MFRRPIALICLALAACQTVLASPTNLVTNGDFERAGNDPNMAADWQYASGTSPDKAPKVELKRDSGHAGQFSQMVRCTGFTDGHVMLAQVGKIAIEGGKTYELSFWAKGEALPDVAIALRDTTTWQDAGLSRSFAPSSRWRPTRFRFTATRTLSATSRLQFWFTSTGTLWLDDVDLVETPPLPTRIPFVADWPAGRRNCLLNASFELGDSYWFTNGYWKLEGVVETSRVAVETPRRGVSETAQRAVSPSGLGAAPEDGHRCLRIDFDPTHVPVESFDYYDPSHDPLPTLAVAPTYWVAVEPNADYVVSGYARASHPIKGIIGVRYPNNDSNQDITIGEQPGWQRFVYRFKAQGNIIYPFFGPVTKGQQAATVWLDALQLERGTDATAFEPRRQVEIAARTAPWRDARPDGTPPPIALQVIAANAGDEPAVAGFDWKATDGFDADAATGKGRIHVPGHATAQTQIASVSGGRPLGFARIRVTSGDEALPVVRTGIALPTPATGDTALGINHAYGWDDWLTRARHVGINWARDWTLKWQYVEPKRDQFEIEKADYWIDRPLKLGMNVLCMFPFPSSQWDAETPPKQPPADFQRYYLQECAFRPRDLDLFQRWMTRCVDHYKNRIHTWEIFNESIFTEYSLPRAFGYEAQDYVPLLKAANSAIKAADPNATVIGGYSMAPGLGRGLYQRMFADGGLGMCDAVSVHEYPQGTPEGSDQPAATLAADMKAAGRTLPMWMTEFAYYADDDPDPGRAPMDMTPIDDELSQAAYTVRYCTMMFSHGVTHIFFHIWNSSVNHDNGVAMLWEANGDPHKVAPAVATLSRMLGPQPKFVTRVAMGEEGQYALIFSRGQSQVAVLWDMWATPDDAEPVKLSGKAPAGRWTSMFGEPLRAAPTSLSAMPVYLETPTSAAELARQVQAWAK